MRDQEIIGLMEAYSSIYTQPQELTEEVEIAAHYFYEMGLNEDGVDILIEELGVEEFAKWVYDISEEYYLPEATRLQTKGALKGPKGSKPQSTTKAREKVQGGTTMKVDAAPASTISPKKVAKRRDAAKEAQEKQPEKKGGLGAIADRVREGMKRHNQAMSDTGKTLRKVGKAAGKVAGGFASGLTGAAKFAGAVAKEVTKEEADLFDIILEHLVAEGYAETNEAALAIMANMSEEWKQSIVEEIGIVGPPKKPIDKIPGVRGLRIAAANAVKASDYPERQTPPMVGKHVIPTERSTPSVAKTRPMTSAEFMNSNRTGFGRKPVGFKDISGD